MTAGAPSPFADFAPHLRKLGFRKTWRSQAGGQRMDEWQREHPADQHGLARTLTAQLWADGKHRVSHMVYSDPETRRHGSSDTMPSDFTTHEELRAAIAHETARMDNKKYAAIRDAQEVS